MRLIVMPTRRLVVLPVALLLALSGCGSGGDAPQKSAGSQVTLDAAKLDMSSTKHIRLRGPEHQILLMVRGKAHSGGGYQLHLFATLPNDAQVEVLHDKLPVLPFVVTASGGMPMTATCTKNGGIEVLTAETHEPPGVILAWNVTRTTYSIVDATARETSSKLIGEAADPTLRAQRPEMYDPTKVFADCTVGTQ
jgi:hypothetical protein